ncbi:MAG: hypothetical protein WA210_02400 [Burkholderiaceae bacterium]
MKKLALVSLAATLAGLLIASHAAAVDPAFSTKQLKGQKLDSGLGSLPHYRYWADKSGKNPVQLRVAGESLDDGSGNIKPFSLNPKTGLPANAEVAQRR